MIVLSGQPRRSGFGWSFCSTLSAASDSSFNFVLRFGFRDIGLACVGTRNYCKHQIRSACVCQREQRNSPPIEVPAENSALQTHADVNLTLEIPNEQHR